MLLRKFCENLTTEITKNPKYLEGSVCRLHISNDTQTRVVRLFFQYSVGSIGYSAYCNISVKISFSHFSIPFVVNTAMSLLDWGYEMELSSNIEKGYLPTNIDSAMKIRIWYKILNYKEYVDENDKYFVISVQKPDDGATNTICIPQFCVGKVDMMHICEFAYWSNYLPLSKRYELILSEEKFDPDGDFSKIARSRYHHIYLDSDYPSSLQSY